MVTNISIDTSYANYRRLADMLLIPVDRQLVSLDWQWMNEQNKFDAIERLMNLAEARDKPDSTGSEVAW